VVKPTIARGFDYKTLHWADLSRAPEPAEISLVPQAAPESDAEVLAA
jgi:hypothetical protein